MLVVEGGWGGVRHATCRRYYCLQPSMKFGRETKLNPEPEGEAEEEERRRGALPTNKLRGKTRAERGGGGAAKRRRRRCVWGKEGGGGGKWKSFISSFPHPVSGSERGHPI